MIISLEGKDVFYHTGGVAWDATRPHVVLLHCAGADHSIWQGQTRALAHGGYNVAALDLPGHGRSAANPGLQSIEDMAHWLADLLRALEIPRAILVGNSLGSLIALTHAALHPDSTRALALTGSGLAMPVSEVLLRDLAGSPAKAVEFIAAYTHAPRNHLGSAPNPGTSQLGGARALISACPPDVLLHDFQACNAWQGSAYVAKVACPTLVLHGTEDRMVPLREARKLADALAHGEMQTLHCGHFPQTELPRETFFSLRNYFSCLQGENL